MWRWAPRLERLDPEGELAVLSDLFKTKKPEELMNEPAVQRLMQDPAMMQAVLRMMAGAAR